MKARVTMSVQPDGSFELHVNDAGRALLIKKLQGLSEQSDHFHLEHDDDAEVPLSAIAYNAADKVLLTGRVLFRPDEWDQTYFPHVMGGVGGKVR